MPGKRGKYNARFPPARIKKIMQSDEEVGKVAAAVPVIISRALELFVENLLSKANNVINHRGSRILTPSHIKLCIQSEQRFDFLKELVSSVPDLQGDTDCPDTPMSATPTLSSPWSSAPPAAPSTAPASLSSGRQREFVFPETTVPPPAADSSEQRLSRTSSTESASSRNDHQHLMQLLQQQQQHLPPSTVSNSKSKRGRGSNTSSCNSRAVGRPRKDPVSAAGSLPPSMQPTAIKPKKPHPAVAIHHHHPRTTSSSDSNKRQHKQNNNVNNSYTTAAAAGSGSQYYPSSISSPYKVQLEARETTRPAKHTTSGTARNVGHVNDEDDDDVVMVAASGRGGASVALDLSVRNGGHPPAPHHPAPAPPKEGLPVLISTPTFVLSYPSFTVSASAAASSAAAATASAANSQTNNVQGCDADTGVLVIDEDYEC